MKTILALALAALAAAEPEANADAYYGLGGDYGGYRTYGLGSYGVYGKREAEPKADAYYGYGGYGLGGYYGGYRTLGLGYGHSVYGYGKRAAEPYYGVYSGHVAPVLSYAHHGIAAPVVHTVGHPVVSSYASVSPSASLTTLGAAPAAIPA